MDFGQIPPPHLHGASPAMDGCLQLQSTIIFILHRPHALQNAHNARAVPCAVPVPAVRPVLINLCPCGHSTTRHAATLHLELSCALHCAAQTVFCMHLHLCCTVRAVQCTALC
jgi:hypothetical protein